MFSTIKRNLFGIYARIKYPLPMWRLLNKRHIHSFQKQRPALNQTQQRIVSELNEKGIATTSLDELFPKQQLLQTYTAHLTELEKKLDTKTKKGYLQDYWEKIPKLSLADPIMAFALNNTILDTVNSYLDMHSQLAFFFLQKTEIRKGHTPEYSQRWHRDPQEQRFCKVFIYLTDVDETAGPFTYIPHSTKGHTYGNFYPQKPPKGSYPPDGAVETHIPPTKQEVMTGKAGTVIFCDTTGLHKGGYATEKERIMATFAYGAQTFRENISYTCSNLERDSLSPQAVAAIKKQCVRTKTW